MRSVQLEKTIDINICDGDAKKKERWMAVIRHRAEADGILDQNWLIELAETIWILPTSSAMFSVFLTILYRTEGISNIPLLSLNNR